MLSRFHLISECYGRTNRRTDRQTDLLYQYRASVCWRATKTVTNVVLVVVVRRDLGRVWRRSQWLGLRPCHSKKRQIHVRGSLHVTVLVNGRNMLSFYCFNQSIKCTVRVNFLHWRGWHLQGRRQGLMEGMFLLSFPPPLPFPPPALPYPFPSLPLLSPLLRSRAP